MVQTRRNKKQQEELQQEDQQLQGAEFQQYRNPDSFLSSSSDDDSEEHQDQNDDEEPQVAGKASVSSSSSSSESSSSEEETGKPGLSQVALVTLLKAIEQGGGLDNHTKENHKLSAICNGDKQLFGAPGTKKRRQAQNKLSHLKSLSISAYCELLTDNGIVPSRATLDKYKSQPRDQVQTPARKKKTTKKPSSTPVVEKENLQQNKKQTPNQYLASPSSRAPRANTSNKKTHTTHHKVVICLKLG